MSCYKELKNSLVKNKLFYFPGKTVDLFLFKLLFQCFAEEALLGYSTFVNVTLMKDGSIRIQDDGRGVFFDDEHPLENRVIDFYAIHHNKDKAPIGWLCGNEAEKITKPFCFENDEFWDSSFNMAATQYLSEYFTIASTRVGSSYKVSCRDGFLVKSEPDILLPPELSHLHGTLISYKTDPQYCEEIGINFEALKSLCNKYAVSIPGLTVILSEENGEEFTYCYQNGIEDRIAELCDMYKCTDVFISEVTGEAKDRYDRELYDAKVRIAYCFCEDYHIIEAYHNYMPIGSPFFMKEGVEALARALSWNRYGGKYTAEEVAEHLIMICECYTSKSYYSEESKSIVLNKALPDMTRNIIFEDARDFLKKNDNSNAKLIRSWIEEDKNIDKKD